MVHPETPEEQVDLIRRTLVQARRQVAMGPAGPIYKAWGLAWMFAFLAIHLLDQSVALTQFRPALIGVVLALSLGVATIFTVRYTRTPRGVSSPLNTRIGLAWGAAFMLASLAVATQNPSGEQIAFVFAYTVAILYLAFGAVFFDNLQMGMGLWLGAVNTLALAMGPRGYSLVMALAGGGGLLVAGFLADRRQAPKQ